MICVNQVFLLGTLGRDPEIRTTSGGTTIATFSVATNESYKDAQGNWKDEATWHSLKCFGKLAEIARDQLKKGTRVFVEGKLTVEEWVDKTSGAKRSKTVIVASYLSAIPTARSVAGTPPAPTPSQDLRSAMEITNDDLPF